MLQTLGDAPPLAHGTEPADIDPAVDALQLRLRQYEAELQLLRTSKNNADLEIVELQMLLRAAQDKLHAQRNSATYRLGKIFIEGTATWAGALRLVPILASFIWVEAFGGRQRLLKLDPGSRQQLASRQAKTIAEVLSRLKQDGAEAAIKWARDAGLENDLRARVLLEIARSVRRSDLTLTIALGREVIGLAPSESRTKWLAFVLADAGAVQEPADLLGQVLQSGGILNPSETRRADELFALARMKSNPVTLPHGRAIASVSHGRRALLVAKRSLPYHWSAATLRLHATAQALVMAGWQVDVVTLPGYPNRPSDPPLTKPSSAGVAGVTYHRLPAKADEKMVDIFAGEAAEGIARLAMELGVTVIHASSDLMSAYAGALAARLASVPVVVDCAERMPDLPSFDPEARRTERFALYQDHLTALAREADLVIGRTDSLADVLVEQGVAKDKILRLPDFPVGDGDAAPSADLETPAALSKRLVLGYVGEGSEDLDLEALPRLLATLVSESIDAGLLLVGSGRRIEALKTLAVELGVADRVVCLPRPRLQTIQAHYRLIDIVVLPYRSRGWRSPYEIVEAMSRGACVLTTDQFDARALLGDYGVFATDGRLAEAAAELARHPDRRESLGRAAAARAATLLTPQRTGRDLARGYELAWQRRVGIDPKVIMLPVKGVG